MSSNADSSSLSLESSFRLEPAYSNEGVESEKNPKAKRKRTTWVLFLCLSDPPYIFLMLGKWFS